METGRQVKSIREKYGTLHKENKRGKNYVMKPMRSESMASVEISNYTTEVVRRHCTKTMKKSLERKPAHLQYVLRQRTVISY